MRGRVIGAWVAGLLLMGCTAAVAAAPSAPVDCTITDNRGAGRAAAEFKATVAGKVTGIRFYKGVGNTGTHTGSLWSGATRLATGTFTGETSTGWQSLTFATPVQITAGALYVASYFAPGGEYAVTNPYAFPKVNGNLTATRGLFKYGASSAPTNTYQTTNYFVDVTFIAGGIAPPTTTAAPTTTPPVASWPDATTSGNRGVICSKAMRESVTLNENCTVQDSWIPAHASAMRASQDTRYLRNRIHCEAQANPVGGGCSAGLTMYGDFAPVQNVLAQGNLFEADGSSGFCAYGGSSSGKPYSNATNNVVYRDNVFERGVSGVCGQYGAIVSFDSTKPGNMWVNNKWNDGAPVNP